MKTKKPPKSISVSNHAILRFKERIWRDFYNSNIDLCYNDIVFIIRSLYVRSRSLTKEEMKKMHLDSDPECGYRAAMYKHPCGKQIKVILLIKNHTILTVMKEKKKYDISN